MRCQPAYSLDLMAAIAWIVASAKSNGKMLRATLEGSLTPGTWSRRLPIDRRRERRQAAVMHLAMTAVRASGPFAPTRSPQGRMSGKEGLHALASSPRKATGQRRLCMTMRLSASSAAARQDAGSACTASCSASS